MLIKTILVPVCLVAFTLVEGFGQQLKVKEEQGHLSPLRAQLTFKNERVREVVLTGIGSSKAGYPHVFFVRTEGGASKRTIWIDSISTIKGLDALRSTRSEFTIALKNGTEFPALFVQNAGLGTNCDWFTELTDPENACSILHISNADESKEAIDMRELKSIEFLPAPRKDKADNVMFDGWRFSPFTGEKLPN